MEFSIGMQAAWAQAGFLLVATAAAMLVCSRSARAADLHILGRYAAARVLSASLLLFALPQSFDSMPLLIGARLGSAVVLLVGLGPLRRYLDNKLKSLAFMLGALDGVESIPRTSSALTPSLWLGWVIVSLLIFGLFAAWPLLFRRRILRNLATVLAGAWALSSLMAAASVWGERYWPSAEEAVAQSAPAAEQSSAAEELEEVEALSQPRAHRVIRKNGELIALEGESSVWAPEVTGYLGHVPICLRIDLEGRILGVEMLAGHVETPSYWRRIRDSKLCEDLKGRSVLEPLQGGSDVDVVSQATYTSVAVIDAARLTGIRMLQQLSGLYGEKIEAVETPPSGDKHFDFKVLVPLLLLLLGVWLDRTQSKVSEGHASSRQSEGFAAVERSVPESERMQSKVSEGHSIPASHRAGSVPESERMQSKVSEGHSIPASHRAGSVPESERMQSKVSEGHSIPASHRAGSVPESERRRWSWLRNAALLLSLLLLGGYLQSFFSIQQGLDLVLKLRGALTGQLSFPELPQLAIWYVLILVALGSALLGGRFYCNTVCPFGALSELAGRLSRHRIRLPARVEKQALRLKFVVLFTLAVLFSASQDARFFAIEPFADTFTFAFLDEAMTAIWIGLLLLASLLLPRAFCRYLCPAGAMMAFLSCHRLVRRARPDKCEGCGECIVVCERRVQAGIKREAAALRDQGPWVKASEASAETASAAQQKCCE